MAVTDQPNKKAPTIKKASQPTSNKKSNTPSTKKNESGKKPRVKHVLSAPSLSSQGDNDGWPRLSKKQEADVTKLLEQLAANILMKQQVLKPKWNVLSKIPSADRSQEIQKHRVKCLEEMDEAKRKEFLEDEKRKDFNLKNVLWLGYNQIMRRLKKGEVALVLVNKAATPDFLPKTFLPVCNINNVPVIAIDHLDQKIKQKCIAIGFKNLIKRTDVDLHPLYAKAVEVLNFECDVNSCLEEEKDTSHSAAQGNKEKSNTSIADQSYMNSSSPAEVPLLKSSTQSLGNTALTNTTLPSPTHPPPPVVDMSKFHLKRSRTDQRAFVPNLGLNPAASQQEADFLVLPRYPLLELSDDETPSSSMKAGAGLTFRPWNLGSGVRRTSSWKGPNREQGKVVEKDEAETLVIPTEPSPAISSQSSDLLFQLDFDGVDDTIGGPSSPNLDVGARDQQLRVEGTAAGRAASDEDSVDEDLTRKGKQLKRKHTLSSAAYVPAAVKRVVGKMNKRKKKKLN